MLQGSSGQRSSDSVQGSVCKAYHPSALSGVLVETCPQGLRLVAYDLDELGIETFIPVTDRNRRIDGHPCKYFSDISRKLPQAEVVLEFREETQSVTISAGRADFVVKTMPAIEFPALPEIPEANSWSMPEGELKTMIRRTRHSCGGRR
jgi:DNA polymerase-3 subunit beta